MSCKARNCQYYKMCLAKYDCADFMCADYKAKPKKEKTHSMQTERRTHELRLS